MRLGSRLITGLGSALVVIALSQTPAAAANPTGSFAGYSNSSSTGVTFTSATAHVQLPTRTCPATGSSMAQVLFGWRTGGATNVFVAADLHCDNGSNTADASFGIGNDTGDLAASPGDVISGDFSYDPTTGDIRLVARNITTGQKMVLTKTQLGLTWTGALDELIPISGDTCNPFTPIRFGNLTIDGQPLATTLTMSAVDLFSSQRTRVIATTSPFNNAAKGFNIKYQAA